MLFLNILVLGFGLFLSVAQQEQFVEVSMETAYVDHCKALPSFHQETFEVFEGAVYGRDKEHVYFVLSGCEEFGTAPIIEGADPETFEVLLLHQEVFYAKDHRFIYKDDEVLEGADLETFEVLSNRYAKDKNAVYEFGEKREGEAFLDRK